MIELINKNEQDKTINDLKHLIQICPFPYFYLKINGKEAVIVKDKYGYEWFKKANLNDILRIVVY